MANDHVHPIFRNLLNAASGAIEAAPDEPTQDAEVLEQGLNAAQERWARLVSDVVCGRPR